MTLALAAQDLALVCRCYRLVLAQKGFRWRHDRPALAHDFFAASDCAAALEALYAERALFLAAAGKDYPEPA